MLFRSILSKARIFMRYLSDGSILYTYSDFIKAKKDLSRSPVFIAPNSLYSREFLERSKSEMRNTIIYSGRLVAEKKVNLLLLAFKESRLANIGISLVIIGDGPEIVTLKALVEKLEIGQSVIFRGEVFDSFKLKESYARAIVAVSPGYVGLSITQCAGFGVPIIFPSDDKHSPEIELIQKVHHYQFKSNDYTSLSECLRKVFYEAQSAEFENKCEVMVQYARENYSLENMIDGLVSAILNKRQNLGPEGFPHENQKIL